MNVRTEASSPNGGRSIAVELSDADGELEWDDWAQMAVPERFRRLSARADMLLVVYLARENMITPEQARQRLATLRTAVQP